MSNGGQGGGDDKNALQILWVIFGFFALGFIIWWFLADEIKTAYIFVKYWELKISSYIIEFFNITPLIEHVSKGLNLAENVTTRTLNPPIAIKIGTVSGEYVRFPVILFILLVGYKLYGKNIKVRYRKRYDMKALLQQEKALWPQVQIVSNLNLVDTDLDEGPWAMGMPPLDFAKKYNLIEVEAQRGASHGEYKFIAKLDHKKTNKMFTAQLGRAWRGPNHMAPHRKALLAVFIARGCRDTKIARQIISNLNFSIGAGKAPNYAHVDDMIKKYINARKVKEFITVHAYETTVITSAMLFGREDGVLAVADFLWLKPLDRRFWFVLNGVGRQTPWSEAAGIHAHWLAEKSLGRSLTVPFVLEATKALQIAMNEIIYIPAPKEKDELLKKAKEAKHI